MNSLICSIGSVSITMIVASTASGAMIAGWTIPAALTGTLTGSSYTVGVADTGDQTAGSSLSGTHALATSVWSSPAGNGSTYSFSSNGWSINDYYQVVVSTSGYTDIGFSFDQTRSSTGPATFSLSMSVDGGANFWVLISNYAVIQAGLAGSGTTTWNATTSQSAFTISASALSGASNTGSVIFRISDTSATGASTGTGRIDNIFVTGSAIPAPGALALLGLAGFVARRRRELR